MLLEFILLGNSIISPMSRSSQMADRREGGRHDSHRLGPLTESSSVIVHWFGSGTASMGVRDSEK